MSIRYCVVSEGMVPYMGGEIATVGDRVKDATGQLATVVEVGKNTVIVKWDEGVVGIEYPTEQFTLVVPAAKSRHA